MSEIKGGSPGNVSRILAAEILRSRADRARVVRATHEVVERVYTVAPEGTAAPPGLRRANNAAREVERQVDALRHPVLHLSELAAWQRNSEAAIANLRQKLSAARSRAPELAAELEAAQARTAELSLMVDNFAARLSRPQTVATRGTGALGERKQAPGTFALLKPDGERVAAWVTPKLLPARLQVAAPEHGQLHVAGLARLFPAGTVHARRSTTVVAGNHCELRSTDHYHVHRVSVSLDRLLTSGSPGRAALRELLKDHTASGIATFQRQMRSLTDRHEHPANQASLPLQPHHHTTVTSSEAVALGDHSRMTVNTHYIIEESTLPIIDLLAYDKGLVRALVAAAIEPDGEDGARRFLRDALRAGGGADEMALLDHSADPRWAPSASIFWLFGTDTVNHASAVMVGADNRLTTGMRLDRGRTSPGTILADLARIREEAGHISTFPIAFKSHAIVDALRLTEAPAPNLHHRGRFDPLSPI